jgi:hypothetical protein
MTRNLKQLFDKRRHGGLAGDLADRDLDALFDKHGEALVWALEKCVRSAHPAGCDIWEGGGCTCGKIDGQKLLNIIEQEAT